MNYQAAPLLVTRGVNAEIERSGDFAKFVIASHSRYLRGDWGDMPESDKAMNDRAVKNNDDRIVARYNSIYGDIYIITEYDCSATTILFTDEY